MSFFLLIVFLAAVVTYILWVLLKPKKTNKKVTLKKKSALKNIPSTKKQKALVATTDQITRNKVEQMKKDPEVISQVVRYWLNEK